MKNIYLIATLVLFMVIACKPKESNGITTDLIEIPETVSGENITKKPSIKFEKDVHNFGRMFQGENIVYSFKFKNTGTSDLLISDCKATCGCTVADFPKDIIKPGAEGYISVSFNSSGKRGQQNQVVTVISNAQPNTNYLTIRAEVVEQN